jgi:hypothetical protein
VINHKTVVHHHVGGLRKDHDMPEIHFECPRCAQTIDAPEELASQLVECPTCKETIEVPIRSQPSAMWKTESPAQPPPKPPEPAPKPSQSRVATPQTILRPGDIICPNPNCGYTGPPKIEPRGSFAVGLLLCLLCLLPGLIYVVMMSGSNYVCPRCGVHIREGIHS